MESISNFFADKSGTTKSWSRLSSISKLANSSLYFGYSSCSIFSYWSLASSAYFDLKRPVATKFSITLPNCFFETSCLLASARTIGLKQEMQTKRCFNGDFSMKNGLLKKQDADLFIKSWKSTFFKICAFF